MKDKSDSRLRGLAVAALLFGLAAPAFAEPEVRSHDAVITLDPATGTVSVRDEITLDRGGGGPLEFSLLANLSVTVATLDGRSVEIVRDADEPLWRTDVPAGPGPEALLVLHYAGHYDGLGSSRAPLLPLAGSRARFALEIRVPLPNLAVSSGALIERTVRDGQDVSTWRTSANPCIFAGRVGRSERTVGDATLGTYLTDAHAARADEVLDALESALRTCTNVLGPLPGKRFDVLEGDRGAVGPLPGLLVVARNEFDGSLDVPADDVFGRAVARTWWGDTVYSSAVADWSDALAEYCVAHIGVDDRQAAARRARTITELSTATQRYAATALRDLDPTDNSDGVHRVRRLRGAMVFHALRRDVGDEAFRATLAHVRREHAGEAIGWDDWRAAFESVSGRNLESLFTQWLDRPGAPHLLLGDVRVETTGGRTRVVGTVRQDLGPTELPWRLSVPVVVEMVDGREETEVLMDGEDASFSLLVSSLPIRVEVDPDHHVLRRLSPVEIGNADTPPVSLTSKRILPDLRTTADPARVKRVLERLVGGDAAGRRAGAPAEAAARRIIESELRETGASVRTDPFEFVVRHAHESSGLDAAGRAVAGALPVVPSPATPAEGVTASGVATDPSDDLTGRALVLDVPAHSARPLDFVRAIASLARGGGAVALLVRVPADDPDRVRSLCATPENLPGGAGRNDPELIAARLASGGDELPLALPTMAIPADADLSGPLVVRVAWNAATVESAIVVARLAGKSARDRGAIVIAAPLDGLGPGFPGAGDAAGLAALVEAAHILAARHDLLSRDVLFVALGAEEWGRRGSRALVRSFTPEGIAALAPAAVLLVGSVGHATRIDVALLGADERPRLARVGAAAIEEASLVVTGSDAYPGTVARDVFEAAGLPCIAFGSADPALAGTAADTLAAVDAKKTARVARALALAALALSAGY